MTESTAFQVLGGFGLVLLVLIAALNQVKPPQAKEVQPDTTFENLRRTLGATNIPRGIFALGAAIWILIATLLTLGLVGLLWQLVFYTPPQSTMEMSDYRFFLAQIAAITTVTGAAIAFPFTMIRLRLSHDEAERANQVLFDEKINSALEDLHSMRQVSLNNDPHQTIWEADVTRRNGAIDRLLALSKQQPPSAERIGRILATYVRELSTEMPPETLPDGLDSEEISSWQKERNCSRTDLQSAIKAIGLLPFQEPKHGEKYRFNLRNANLQGCELVSANFSSVDFRFAHFEAAVLLETDFSGSDFRGAALGGAYCDKASFCECIFGAHPLENNTGIERANFNAAAFFETPLEQSGIGNEQLADTFGSKHCTIPNDCERPEHWPSIEMEVPDFFEEWNLYKSDPGAYKPPQDRD